MDKETPITKYLATLERRQAQRERDLFGSPSSPSPGVSPESRNLGSIRQQLRFDDETFLQPHDQSIAPTASSFNSANRSRSMIPTPTSLRNPVMLSGTAYNALNRGGSGSGTPPLGGVFTSNGFKRKRYSFEDRDDEEKNIKKICELEKLLRQTTGELVEARAITAKLERQKMELRTESSDKALKFEKYTTEMKIKTRDALEKAEEMQKENEKNKKKLDELKDELRRQSVATTDKILCLESKVSKLQCENVELTQKFDEDKLNQSDTMKKMSTNLHDSEKSTEKWSVECQILKDQLAVKETQLSKYQEELKEAQFKIFKYDELQSKLGQMDTSEAHTLSLQNEIRKYENLYVQQQNENNRIAQQLSKVMEENGYFKSTMSKEMLLEEQITSFDAEVKRLREMLNSKNDVEVERDVVKEKLAEWIHIGEEINPEYACPKKFKTFISQTQTDLFELKDENTTLKCKIDGMDTEMARLEKETSESKTIAITSKTEIDKLNMETKQLSRKITLLTKDRDGLKSLKESYEQELEAIISIALKERVIQLESLVAEYEQIVNGENGDPSSSAKSCRECSMRIALISDLRSELERAKANQDATVMGDITMNSDDGNTTGVKIVTFGMNPSMLSLEARIKELSNENETLKTKIKQLEEQSILAPSDDVVVAGRKVLKDQLRTLERKHQLLTEAYDYETQQLQMALNKLFGYHVILVREPQSQFRLQSVYGAGPEDELVFQEAENSDMMLLETPVLDNFRDDIDRCLLREGSIPAFLSAVTIAFSQGQVQQVDSSQFPSSQQSSAGDADETVTVNPNRGKMIEVVVEGRDNGDSDEEDEESDMEEAEEEEAEMDEEREGPYTDDEEVDEEEDEEERRDLEFRNRDSDDGDVVCIDSD